MPLYAGLISGTSMDGVEAVLLDVASSGFIVLDGIHLDYADGLAMRLKRAVADPATCDLDELGHLDAAIGESFGLAARELLEKSGAKTSEIRAIGSHGQTVLHRPRAALPYTIQIGDPSRIAEITGIDVVADFRRRDMAAGGEAAPLAPAFHLAAFGAPGEDRAVVNIGGIANITLLKSDGSVLGFDTGPGNCLMDLWASEHLGTPYDKDGALAAQGEVQDALLRALLAEPYLALQPPKSTGRELFRRAWLDPILHARAANTADVQATLSEYTATTIAQALQIVPGFAPAELLVCGGGAFNKELMRRLAARIPHIRVADTSVRGIAPERVEAALFAWLAHRYIEGLPGNLMSVTGARGPRVLGALYKGAVTGVQRA
ncbi:MAG: anhydro-N-acetylmuramic acid kinase [Pseudomonadota bacterium]